MIGTVDLPAHNVASTTVTVPDPECLADSSDATGITLTHPDDIFYVGSTDGNSGGTALGFGLWDPDPAGSHPYAQATAAFVGTVTNVSLVAHAQRLGSSFDVPAGSWTSSVIQPVPTVGPSLAVGYDGLTLPVGYALTPDGTLSELVGTQIQHVLHAALAGGTADYVIAGVGTPDTGTYGLCPRVFIADSNWWEFPRFDSPILLTYLAIRITYTAAATDSTMRKYPNPTGLGVGPARHWPPPRRGISGIR